MRTLLCVIVLLLMPAHVGATDPLRLKLSTVTSGIRSDAPLSLNVHLDWASTELLEGRLELACYDGSRLLLRSIGSDVALFAGDRLSRTVLPPVSLSSDLTVLTVNARFLSDTSNYDLGSFDLRVPVHWRRSFVVAVMVPNENARTPGSAELGQSLRLEQLTAGEVRANELVSISSQITPDDLRASGLELYSFDILAVTRQAFRVLTPDQFDMINGWVESGGSLLVIVDDQPSTAQAGFLNQIAGISANGPAPGDISDLHGTLRMYRPGMGRAVILPADAQAVTATDLSEAAGFLWKVRNAMQSDLRDRGTSPELTKRLSGLEVDQYGEWRSGEFDASELMSPFQHVRLPEADSLTTILLPDNVQSLPLKVVVLILTLFLIAIVPLDYFILGHFNNRRLTWIVLPIVSLLFTGLTTGLGNAYLGSTDYRTSLEFVDLTTGNRVIRSSRFEMMFTATQREAASELKQTLYAAISVKDRVEADEWTSGHGMMTYSNAEETDRRTEQPRDSESQLYDGNMPTLFTVRQQMRKWSPQFSRQTALQTDRSIPLFDLDEMAATWRQTPEVIRNSEWQKSLRDRIHAALPDSTVMLFTQQQILDLTEGDGLRNPDQQAGSSSTKVQKLLELVRKVCVRPASGLFSVVAQISPNAAGNFEDLSIVDPDDAGQLLLVIVMRQGSDFVVLRRLFHKGS